MATNYNDHMTEMDDDRMSDISMATTCFGGHLDNPHVNELREMRSSISALRRRMMTEYKAVLSASPDDLDDLEPDFDLTRATYGKSIIKYIQAARAKVTDGLLNEFTLNAVADSVERMKKAWQKTKYFGKHQPNFVFMTDEEIKAPIRMLNGGTKRTASDLTMNTDIHLTTPMTQRQRTSSPKDAASPALPVQGFLRPEGLPRRTLPQTTPKTEVKAAIDKKEEDIVRWVQETGAFDTGVNNEPGVAGALGVPGVIVTNGAAPASTAPPAMILDPKTIKVTKPNAYALKLDEEVKKEREEMQKRMREEVQRQVQAEVAKATAAKEAAEQKLQNMHQEFRRQMKERVELNEQQIQSIQNQAKAEIERADKEREVIATAAIEQEMQKVRKREEEADRLLLDIEEQRKTREEAAKSERAANYQQQQRAERQIADLKKELKKQKAKDAQKQSSPGHPLHEALHKRQKSNDTVPKTVVNESQRQESRVKDGSREEYEHLLDSSNEESYASPSARESPSKMKAVKFATPLGYGKLSSESFFAMKQLAINKAKDARPEEPFSGGTSIEYALHMNAFDAATDNDALDSKDKLFELTKWFSGPAGRIIKAHNVNNDKEMAYAMVRSQLDVFFSQHRDSFAETLKKVKKGKQIDKNDYQAHFELFSELVEAQMALVASGQVQEFDRRDVLRDILESRLEHMADSFWEKDEE